jgi:hypothetical protein
MSDNIHQINWHTLGHHIYGAPGDIPTFIHNLLAPDAPTRQAARDFLLGSGQDDGDIYDTTPHILPFLIPILADPHSPDRAELLAHITSVAEHIHYPCYTSIHMKRLCLATYTALQSGLPTFLTMLAENSHVIRQATTFFLQYLTDDADTLIPILTERLRYEGDEEIRITIVQTLKVLFGSLDWFRTDLRNHYAPFFRDLLTAPISPRLRVAVTRMIIELLGLYNRQNEPLFPDIAPVLVQEFLAPSSLVDDGDHHQLRYATQQLAYDIARLKSEPFVVLLQDPRITAAQAHELTRGLLANAFFVRDKVDWEYFPDMEREHEGLFYRVHYTWHTMDPHKHTILQAIVDADKVWEIPTNLFSFFYGLPDSRDALRTYLHRLKEGQAIPSYFLPEEKRDEKRPNNRM